MECSICCNELCEEAKHTLPCQHAFHGSCIIEWFRRGWDTCPMCRASTLSQRALSPTERWTRLRRQKTRLPEEQKKLMGRYDAWKRKRSMTMEAHRAFRQATMGERKAYTKIHTKLRNFRTRSNECLRHMTRIQRAMTSTACPTVPLVVESMDSEDEEDNYLTFRPYSPTPS